MKYQGVLKKMKTENFETKPTSKQPVKTTQEAAVPSVSSSADEKKK